MVTVQTTKGAVAGAEDDGVHAFLGIRYAAPPVGELRWQPPQPAEPWPGVFDATRFGNAAIQTVNTGMDLRAEQSEDCLNLNVWTTSVDPAASRPVMVWIHGGGFLNGSASLRNWPGDQLCRSGVVVVSMNYRLGAFGFLTHPGAGANFGALDWVAALEWVRDNIRTFGGDPQNVTVFGQSAGGAAARALLSMPSARGLFHKAVIQSAGYEEYAVVGSPSCERSAKASIGVLERLGAESVDAARRASAEQVREASFAFSGTNPPDGEVHTPANLTWYPIVDGSTIVDDFVGWPEDVPVMIGSTQDEARMFVQPTMLYGHPEMTPEATYTLQTLAAMARAMGGERSEGILASFAESGHTPYEAIAEVISAGVWHEPAAATLERFSRLGRTCYAYRFARVAPGAEESGLLANHSAEIAYLFGSMTPPQAYDETDARVAREVRHAWTEFARTGTPSSLDGTPWRSYTEQDPQLAWIADTTEFRVVAPSPVEELIHAARVTSSPTGSGA